jgi:hypothetical protein
MKISIIAMAVLAPVASAFIAPQNPAFSTQLQSSTMPQAWAPPAQQQQQEAPPTATWTPPAPAASQLATAPAPLDEQRGQPLQVYELVDRAPTGQWWKGAYSTDNIAAAGYEGYPSNKFAMQRSRMTQQTQRSVGSKPQPRQGRTWWMGVEGGIGYCQGGP